MFIKFEILNSEVMEILSFSLCKFMDIDFVIGLVWNVRVVMLQKVNKVNILIGKLLKEMQGYMGYLIFVMLYVQNLKGDVISGDGKYEISN